MASIRSPICVVVGHVDHGKSSLLDRIRGTAIVSKEAGAITQAIGASIIPTNTIKELCGDLLKVLKTEITIPGILFIDTPGHAAFTSLRKRGGNLADIAILVVDINEGFKPQTIEAIEILKTFKTPFIIAANKVDLIAGWKSRKDKCSFMQNVSSQSPEVQQKFETKMYELVAKLYEYGFESERFDRLESFTKQLAIIPCSAKSGEGIPELLMILAGLAQKFLEKGLEFDENSKAKGTILEVKEEQGLGKTIDAIIYDGTLNTNDTIVIGSFDGPIVTRIRALLEPAPLSEMRDTKTKFRTVKSVTAAIGVKIAAPDLDKAIAGMPIIVCENDKLDEVKEKIKEEIDQILIETEKEGIVIKADTIGGLEALTNLLKAKGVKIKKADIGNITKKDCSEAEANFEANPLNAIILGFNVTTPPEISSCPKYKILTNQVIYRLLEDFDNWVKETTQNIEKIKMESLTPVCKMTILGNYIFRQSNPAVVGMEILVGKAKAGMPVMNSKGEQLTRVKGIQQEKETVSELHQGKQGAVSMDNVTVGRQINGNDILYSYITEDEFRKYKEMKKFLSGQEIDVLKEIANIMREKNPVWGV